MEVIQFWGKRIDEIGARHCVFRIPAVDGVSSEGWRVAKIFHAPAAIRAGSIHTTHPRNTNARADRQLGRCTLNNIADDLVAGNERLNSLRQFSLDDVQIGAAYAAGSNLQEHLAARRRRLGSFFNVKRVFRRSEDGGFHNLRPIAEYRFSADLLNGSSYTRNFCGSRMASESSSRNNAARAPSTAR